MKDMQYNRNERADSVIRPALGRIEEQARHEVPKMNERFPDPNSKVKVIGHDVPGLKKISGTFSVERRTERGTRVAEFVPNYDNWTVNLIFSDGRSKIYHIPQSSTPDNATFKGPDRDFTENEIALEGCRFVCQE
jgi:hypothetical protein